MPALAIASTTYCEPCPDTANVRPVSPAVRLEPQAMGVPPFCSFIETEPDSTTTAPMILLPGVMLRSQSKSSGYPCTGRASRSAVATRSAPPNRGIVVKSLCTPSSTFSQSLSVGTTSLEMCLCFLETPVFYFSKRRILFKRTLTSCVVNYTGESI